MSHVISHICIYKVRRGFLIRVFVYCICKYGKCLQCFEVGPIPAKCWMLITLLLWSEGNAQQFARPYPCGVCKCLIFIFRNICRGKHGPLHFPWGTEESLWLYLPNSHRSHWNWLYVMRMEDARNKITCKGDLIIYQVASPHFSFVEGESCRKSWLKPAA